MSFVQLDLRAKLVDLNRAAIRRLAAQGIDLRGLVWNVSVFGCQDSCRGVRTEDRCSSMKASILMPPIREQNPIEVLGSGQFGTVYGGKKISQFKLNYNELEM